MKTVKEILKEKGNEIYSVSPKTKVIDALKLFADKNIGAVLVLEDDDIKGIFSERDYARKVILEGQSSKELDVSEIMSDKVLFVDSNRTVEECMALMTRKKVRHLPVYEDRNLVGVVSIGDIVKGIIDGKDNTIKELERYITNRR